MTELLIFLKLCLLAYAVYSGITYLVRRSGNKSAFTRLLQAPVLRVTGYDLPYPPSRVEDGYLPDLDRVLDAVDRSLAH